MNQNTAGLEIALWSLGILFSIVSGLGFLILKGIQQQGRDTNTKVTAQGETVARVEQTSTTSATEIANLRQNFHDLSLDVAKMAGARELAEAIARAFDERIERRREARRVDDR